MCAAHPQTKSRQCPIFFCILPKRDAFLANRNGNEETPKDFYLMNQQLNLPNSRPDSGTRDALEVVRSINKLDM